MKDFRPKFLSMCAESNLHAPLFIKLGVSSASAIGSDSAFLDAYKRTMTATGNLKKLLAETQDSTLRLFLTRGEKS